MWIESFMRVMSNKIMVRCNFPLSLAKIKQVWLKALCATPCTAPGVGLTGGEGMKKRQTHRHTEKLGLECVSVNVCGVCGCI